MKPAQTYFSDNLAFLLETRGISPEQLQQKTGFHAQNLSYFTLNHMVPSLEDALFFADFFDITLDRLARVPMREWYEKAVKKDVQLILFDVDGTLSDGGMYYSENGDYAKKFDVKDGIVVSRLAKRHQVQFGLVSATSNVQILKSRAADLGIQHVYAGKEPKVQVVSRWLEEMGLTFEQVAYVGDDLNDLDMIRAVGVSACPADACWQVKNAAHVVLTKPGGKGCIREFLEEVLRLPTE
jgi:YrbI family 3-deoxy-D-manno-octulosonate 8-phosphate phosphatase